MLYWNLKPDKAHKVTLQTEFVHVEQFVENEEDAAAFFEGILTFRSRAQFLRIWRGVRWLVIHRDEAGKLDGFLCLSPAFNAQPFVRWDIDYVFVREGCRGRGIGMAIMIGAINAAMTPPSLKKTNTVELFFRSRASLRPFYTKAGFQVYAEEE